VVAVTREGVTLDNGKVLSAHHVLWTSGILAVGAKFFPEALLEKGRVKVRSTLQMHDYPEVLVVGDIAAVTEGGGPHPQTAQAAVQQAKLAAQNLAAIIHEQPLRAFTYRHKGDLIPIGDRWALAEIHRLRFTGFFAWWLRRTVYLRGIYSWGDRFRVLFNWTMNLFSHRDTTRL
jgi:NADH dehydrogenase